jgi:hypothetical protein
MAAGGWAPSVASADSVLDPYIAWLALAYSLHCVHLNPLVAAGGWAFLEPVCKVQSALDPYND